MVTSAILGAASGVGMALFVGLTLVVYRHYIMKKKSKEWDSLDRAPLPPDHKLLQRFGKGSHNYSVILGQKEFNVAKEQHNVQPPAHAPTPPFHHGQHPPHHHSSPLKSNTALGSETGGSGHRTTSLDSTASSSGGGGGAPQPLQHQSKSYPGGPPPSAVLQTSTPSLCRTPSVSSQGSVDSAASRQGHRGSSPQIRTFAPDGRSTMHNHPEATHSSSYPLRGSHTSPMGSGGNRRSPSPLRAASLDIRCSSPATSASDLRTPSPSQSSLTSLTGSSAMSSVCNSPVPSLGGGPAPMSPRASAASILAAAGATCVSLTAGTGGGVGNSARCLSPLLLPSQVRSNGGHGDLGLGAVPPASPLGAIQPDLYTRRDVPLFIGTSAATLAVASGEPERSGDSALGRLHFRLKYDFDKSDLVVHLIEAHDLAGSDQGGFNDPYVRVSLEPEVDSRKRQTAIHRNDANPFFDQSFKFPVSHDDLRNKTLVLQVFDYDRYSRNDVIGDVRMAMDEFDVASSIEVWGEISKNRKPPEDAQELLLSLSFLPHAERLTVVLLKAKNLNVKQAKDNTDPYVKVYLVINGKRIKKKKSAVRKGTSNPVWNEALTFALSSANLPNAAIEICVMDQSVSNNPLMGCCLIGPKESGPERDHWIDMVHSQRKAVASWHIIR